jgi:hypothetical protein
MTPASCLETLWRNGFFKTGHTLKEVSGQIVNKWEYNFSSSDISKALARANYLIRTGRRGFFEYKQKMSPVSKRVQSIEEQLFSHDLVSKFGKPFDTELHDLHHNFGVSGNCTAFLLRKILEKAIFLTFAKKGIGSKLEDKSGNGRLLGLEAMVDAAAREKVEGIPFLLPKTAQEIKGIKFLGDVSAHNPLVKVDMETIIPQMPFIITSYKELAEKL